MLVAAAVLFSFPAVSQGAETCTGTCKAACTPPGEVQNGTCTEAPNIGKACCVPPAATGGSITFQNPLSFGTVQGAAGMFLNALQGIIVTLAIIFIVIGGLIYILSGGDEGKIKTAKAAITAAMIGLAIGVAAPSFLKEIYGALGQTAPTLDCTGLTGTALTNCNAADASYSSGLTLAEILMNVLNFLLSVVGVLAIIMLVVGGAMYVTAAGDEGKIDTAKKIVKWAIIGIAVSLSALVIVTQVANFF